MLQQLQQESKTGTGFACQKAKKIIHDYGKEKITTTSSTSDQSASVVYGKPEYDITKEVLKMLNEKYEQRDKRSQARRKGRGQKELDAIEKKK